jgi:hypothetical protein
MQGSSSAKTASDVERALDELQQLEPSDSALELVTRLAALEMTAEENVRLDAVLCRLAQETNDHRYHRESMLHAFRCCAFRPALTRATTALEGMAEGSPDASVERLIAARAALFLSKAAEAQQYVRQMVASGDPPSPSLFWVAVESGLYDLACDTAASLSANGRGVSPHLVERASTAANNQRNRFPFDKVKLISLGPNCNPWQVGNRWGMRAHLDEDWWEMPFNTVAWFKSSVITALEDRFEDFCDPELYQFRRSPVGLCLPNLQNYARVVLNHDGFLPGQVDENTMLKAVLEEYSRRVSNFLEPGCRGPRVYFYHLEWPIDLERLEQALADLGHDEHFLLLVIDECEDPGWPRRRPSSRGRLLIRPMNPPRAEQPWYKLQSDARYRHEGELAEIVFDAVRQVAAET